MSKNLFFFALVSDNKDSNVLIRIKTVHKTQNESVEVVLFGDDNSDAYLNQEGEPDEFRYR